MYKQKCYMKQFSTIMSVLSTIRINKGQTKVLPLHP